MSSPYLSLELIETTAKDTIDDLEREALRTIRQRNQERGLALIQEIEGVQHLLEQIRLRANSELARRSGDVIEHSNGNAQVQHRIAEIRRRRMS